MTSGAEPGTDASWESWTCPRCDQHVTYRSFCPQCGAELSAVQASRPGANPVSAPTSAPPLAPPQTAPHAAAASSRGGRHGRTALVLGVVAVLAGVAVTVGGAVGGAAYLRSRRNRPHWAARWDPRVADLAAYVARERNLTFKHPVQVDFLTPAQYHAKTTASDDKVSATQRKKLDEMAGMMRAIGLAGGKVDLFGAANRLEDDGTLAFYDPETKRVFVRGTELSPQMRVTLVHELTHAAQDQYFDLTRMTRFKTDGAETAFRTLVEGDATRIEDKYVDTLNAADRAAYDKATEADSNSTALDSVPPAMTAMFAAPYALGPPLMTLLETTGGTRAIDDALRVPPTDEGEILDPFRFLLHRSAEQPEPPKVDAGDRKITEGDFGAISLYLMMAQQFDPRVALRAADAWAGDAYVSYAHAGRTCVRVSFLGGTMSDGEALQSLLHQWVAARPAGSASVTGAGDEATLQSCDPGDNIALAGPGASPSSFTVAAARTEFGAGLIKSSVPNGLARCVAGKVVDNHSPADFQDETGAVFQTPAFLNEARRDAAECSG